MNGYFSFAPEVSKLLRNYYTTPRKLCAFQNEKKKKQKNK